MPKMNYIKCDYCNSNNYTLLLKSKDFVFDKIPGEFEIVQCNNCHLVYTNPRIIEINMREYYSELINYGNTSLNIDKKNRFNPNFRNDILIDFFNYPFGKKKKLRKIIQYPNFVRVIRRQKKTQYIPNYIKDGKVLEIGCSYGFFLAQLKKLGWNAKGIELSKGAKEYALNKLNLNVECVSIEDFQTEELFDIIYMYMVLEHVDSPKKVLKKVYSLLKPDGLLIFSIPDFSGIEVKIYKKYAYTLHVPYHLTHFTPITIRNYLNQLNFNKIKIIHSNRDRDIIAPLDFILKEDPNKILIKCIFKLFTNKFVRLTLIRIIICIFANLGITSRMTIIAKK